MRVPPESRLWLLLGLFVVINLFMLAVVIAFVVLAVRGDPWR